MTIKHTIKSESTSLITNTHKVTVEIPEVFYAAYNGRISFKSERIDGKKFSLTKIAIDEGAGCSISKEDWHVDGVASIYRDASEEDNGIKVINNEEYLQFALNAKKIMEDILNDN